MSSENEISERISTHVFFSLQWRFCKKCVAFSEYMYELLLVMYLFSSRNVSNVLNVSKNHSDFAVHFKQTKMNFYLTSISN